MRRHHKPHATDAAKSLDSKPAQEAQLLVAVDDQHGRGVQVRRSPQIRRQSSLAVVQLDESGSPSRLLDGLGST